MPDKRNTTPHTPNTEYSPHKRTRITVGYQLSLTPKALWAKEGVNPTSRILLLPRSSFAPTIPRHDVELEKSPIGAALDSHPLVRLGDMKRSFKLCATGYVMPTPIHHFTRAHDETFRAPPPMSLLGGGFSYKKAKIQ